MPWDTQETLEFEFSENEKSTQNKSFDRENKTESNGVTCFYKCSGKKRLDY